MKDTDPGADLGGFPSWYREIFPAGKQTGFYHKLAQHAVVCVERSPRTLVLSFDNLTQAGNPRYDREAWAGKFLADNNFSHMGIFAQHPSWFRAQDLIDFLTRQRDMGYFARYEKVILTGTSMGGFGALTFSSLVPGATVIAFSPQSTLDAALTPWEPRFKVGKRQDWTLAHSDAARETAQADKVFVIYDPFETPDRLHAERIQGGNVVPLRAPGMGHKTALVLRQINQLKSVMSEAMDGDLTQRRFAELIQPRKINPDYKINMRHQLRARNHPKLESLLVDAIRSRVA